MCSWASPSTGGTWVMLTTQMRVCVAQEAHPVCVHQAGQLLDVGRRASARAARATRDRGGDRADGLHVIQDPAPPSRTNHSGTWASAFCTSRKSARWTCLLMHPMRGRRFPPGAGEGGRLVLSAAANRAGAHARQRNDGGGGVARDAGGSRTFYYYLTPGAAHCQVPQKQRARRKTNSLVTCIASQPL
jgi:hypothetical protein